MSSEKASACVDTSRPIDISSKLYWEYGIMSTKAREDHLQADAILGVDLWSSL